MPLDITTWKSPASMIAAILADALPGNLVLSTNLFIGFQPTKPNNCITVIDTGGGEQIANQKTDLVSVQILGRNEDYKTGYNLLNLVKATLQSIQPVTIDGETLAGVWVKSNIAFIGRDNSNNSMFSSNYRVMINTKKDTNR